MKDGFAEAPVFVVGQPRSGSTLLTRILNEAPDLFVINDFYVLQKIDAAGLWDELSSQQAAQVADWIYERIHIRATEDTAKTISQSIELSEAQLAQLALIVRAPWRDGLTWSDVLATVMSAAARIGGHRRWGYNTPQDHLHLDKLFAAFPDAIALFLLREPVALLKSYKNVRGPWHDARRYNPTTIGLAWRSAARSYLHWKGTRPEQTMLLSYEELTGDTAKTLERLSKFVRADMPPIDLSMLGRNSSHTGAVARLPVSDSEVWLATRPMRQELETLGFPIPNASLQLRAAVALARIYAPSVAFHLKALLMDRDRRRRMLRLVQSLASRGPTRPNRKEIEPCITS